MLHCLILYLSAEPAATILPSGDQAHLNKFYFLKKKKCNNKLMNSRAFCEGHDKDVYTWYNN